MTEIDNALVKYYGIHDSQTSTQSDIENINCNENFNKEDERVGPAIKKRKVDSKEGNQQSNDDVHENILKEKQVSGNFNCFMILPFFQCFSTLKI